MFLVRQVKNDIKPVIVSNETTLSSSDEESPSSLKLKKTFDLTIGTQAGEINTFT